MKLTKKLTRYTEQKCIQELDKVLKNSSKVAILLKGIQALNKDALRRGVTCRPCMGTNKEVSSFNCFFCA